eukprot:COSAG06_NODE_167_length_21546_cov_35.001352_34_plen_79_part_00
MKMIMIMIMIMITNDIMCVALLSCHNGHVLLLLLYFRCLLVRYRKPDLSLSYFDWVVASIQVGAALNESRLFYMCTPN